MKVSLLRTYLLLAILAITSSQSVFGYKKILSLRGVDKVVSLSQYDADPPLYYYEHNTTATVTTQTVTSFGFSHWLWIRLIANLSTPEEKQFLVVILNSTDQKGNEEQLFNNSHFKHQPVFQIGQNAQTGEPTSIRISRELELNHLELARQLLLKIAPTIEDSEMNQLLLSREIVPSVNDGSGKALEEEELTVISIPTSPLESNENGEGIRKISIGKCGSVRKSIENYTLETKGLRTLDGNGNPVSKALHTIKLEVADTFELKRTGLGDSAAVALAYSFFNDDKSVLAYTSNSFNAMVDAVKNEFANKGKEQNNTVQANLRKNLLNPADAEISRPIGEVSYSLMVRKESLVQAPILARVLKLKLITTVNYIVVDSTADNSFNKVGTTLDMLFEFDSKSLLVRLSKTLDFIVPDYYKRENATKGSWEISLPIRFGDGRINFEMTVGLNYQITSTQNLVKIGNQLTLSRNIQMVVDCNAAIRTPDRGGVIGYAHFRGKIVDVGVSQASVLILTNPLQGITDFSAALNPSSYQLFQSFQTYGCWKRTFLWFGKHGWCDWRTAVDQWWTTSHVVRWNSTFSSSIALQ